MHQKETDEINKEINLIKNQNNELQISKKILEEENAYLKMQLNNNKNIQINKDKDNVIQANTLNQNNFEEIIYTLKSTKNNLENDNKLKDNTIKKLKEEIEKKDSENKIYEIKNKNLNEQILKLQNEVLTNTKEDHLNEQLKESNIEYKNQIEKQNIVIKDLENTNKELKSIITGIQNGSNGQDINKEEQINKLNDTITKLEKDNNKLLKNLELFKQENHLAAEKLKQLESLFSEK